MYLHLPANGYHSPAPIAHTATILGALVATYRKRAKRKITVKEYRKTI